MDYAEKLLVLLESESDSSKEDSGYDDICRIPIENIISGLSDVGADLNFLFKGTHRLSGYVEEQSSDFSFKIIDELSFDSFVEEIEHADQKTVGGSITDQEIDLDDIYRKIDDLTNNKNTHKPSLEKLPLNINKGLYTDFYKLSCRPFQLSPNHRFFFGSRGHRRAMAYLTYGLHQREGLIVVTGDVGTGKTTLINYLAEQLSAGPFVAGRVSAGQIEPNNVLPLVAKAFQLPTAGRDQADLQKDIEAFLIARNKVRQRPLLVIDEAQNWPLLSLEELRMLANLQNGGKALVQIILVGQPLLRDALAGEDYEQLRQRVVASHHLENLDDTEVGPYIEHRLKQAGWRGDPTFDADACTLIYEHSKGVPRRINLVCSRLLVLGSLEQRHMIDSVAVEEILEELDQEGEPYEPAKKQSLTPKIDEKIQKAPKASDISQDHWSDVEHWRREAVRLLHKLEQANDDLAGERRRVETIRLEADQLRERLHQFELEQTRAQAESARRSAAEMVKTAPSRASIFRRFGGD